MNNKEKTLCNGIIYSARAAAAVGGAGTNTRK